MSDRPKCSACREDLPLADGETADGICEARYSYLIQGDDGTVDVVPDQDIGWYHLSCVTFGDEFDGYVVAIRQGKRMGPIIMGTFGSRGEAAARSQEVNRAGRPCSVYGYKEVSDG